MDVLFWSGGKDSFLALKFYTEKYFNRHIKLLTTYDEELKQVPFQDLSTKTIQRQAANLGMEVLLTALPPNCPNNLYIEKISKTLHSQTEPIQHLLFGDWYLQDIRQWREQQFGELGISCKFPIWQKDLTGLLNTLTKEPVEVRISNVDKKYQKWIKVGDKYDQRFVGHLPDQIDPMGEKGEFHTEVVFTN